MNAITGPAPAGRHSTGKPPPQGGARVWKPPLPVLLTSILTRMGLPALWLSAESECGEERLVGFAGVEQRADPVVGEAAEPEGGTLDTLQRMIASVGPLVTRARCQFTMASCQRARVEPRRRNSTGHLVSCRLFAQVMNSHYPAGGPRQWGRWQPSQRIVDRWGSHRKPPFLLDQHPMRGLHSSVSRPTRLLASSISAHNWLAAAVRRLAAVRMSDGMGSPVQ